MSQFPGQIQLFSTRCWSRLDINLSRKAFKGDASFVLDDVKLSGGVIRTWPRSLLVVDVLFLSVAEQTQ